MKGSRISSAYQQLFRTYYFQTINTYIKQIMRNHSWILEYVPFLFNAARIHKKKITGDNLKEHAQNNNDFFEFKIYFILT